MKKNKIVNIVIIIVLSITSHFTYAQKNKQELEFLIKLRLYQSSSISMGVYFNQESLENFLQLEFEMDTLKSVGFEYNIIFLRINSMFKNPKDISLDIIPVPINECGEYIIALNILNGEIYKLKGFIYNEFSKFLSDLKYFKYSDINSYKKFIKSYWVEKLDLGCLYKASKEYDADEKKYPCVDDCLNIISTH